LSNEPWNGLLILMDDSHNKRQTWFVCLGLCVVLAAMTFAVFGQTAGFGFVNFDDQKYVYENSVVAKGLTLKGAIWAWTYGEIGHWHPLTWLTHMGDCQVYGLWAGGHHLTNVALHAAAAVLLFLALREMTGSLWRSAFVAAVFAIHPLRAESVAWVSERKDVLSGVFFMLTLWAYARYARQPSRGRYAAVALAYALGLLCKNSLVTLPFVLLLLDWWPLQRVKLDRVVGKVGGARLVEIFWGLIKEKIPLFLLSAGSCVATALVPEQLLDSVRQPFRERLGNAVFSYGIYFWQMVFPAGLAIPYLYPPNGLPFWKVALAFVLLAAISMVVLACWKKRPYLLVGWLWYLGMLIPVIGIIQISYYAHADRYTYLPGIGLVMAVTWLVAEWGVKWHVGRMAMGGLMTAVLGVLMVCARQQTTYWKSSETMWTHTLACIPGNSVACRNLADVRLKEGRIAEAIVIYRKGLQDEPDNVDLHNSLGSVFLHTGKADEAISQYQQALKINPVFETAHINLGNALLQKGRVDEAIAHFQIALQIKPDDAEVQNNLGNAFGRKGKEDEAIIHYQRALQIDPDCIPAHVNFGGLLLQRGKVDEAIAHFQRALEIKPDLAPAHDSLGNALLQKGRASEAIAHFQKALQIEPANPAIQNNLAWLLATCPQASLRNGHKAVELARQANELTGGKNPAFLDTLAAAYAEAGRFPEAVETARHALRLAEAQSNAALAGQLQSEMKLYQAGAPCHVPEQTH
jgi:protein O-mannosyl-transferase